jgi:hypothetical protein
MIAGIVFSTPLLPAAGHWLDHFLANLDPLPKRLVVPALSFARVAGLMLMIFLCSMSLASGTHNPFIYFRF